MQFTASRYLFSFQGYKGLGYVYTGSGIFTSVCDRIHYGTDPLCSHGTGSKLERYGCIWNHVHKWAHLAADSRSDPYRIHQVLCKHKTYPYQFHTGSKRIRFRVNAALVIPNQWEIKKGLGTRIFDVIWYESQFYKNLNDLFLI